MLRDLPGSLGEWRKGPTLDQLACRTLRKHLARCTIQARMRRTFNTRITGPDGDVIVFTKVRYLFLFHLPRTSVMPFSGEQLGAHGVQFHWNTDKEDELERLHLLITAATKKLTLQELRLRLRPDAPAPEELKEISRWIKRVI